MVLMDSAFINFNKDVNQELDDVEFHLPPEPDFEQANNYETETGYTAIVRDNSSVELRAIFSNGEAVIFEEFPF